jgi:hypothetical protein
MERQSSKHSPRVDEELDHETRSLRQGAPIESRAEEARVQEGEGDTDPTPDEILETTGGEPELSHGEVEARSQLARWLRPSAFPDDRDGLLATARAGQAPDAIVEALGRIPDGAHRYATVEEVWEALGGHAEQRF